VALFRASLEFDVRDLLPAIRVPTLVLHRSDMAAPVEHGRYLGENIPGAKYVKMPGIDHASGPVPSISRRSTDPRMDMSVVRMVSSDWCPSERARFAAARLGEVSGAQTP
jgi:hypothetical protein